LGLEDEIQGFELKKQLSSGYKDILCVQVKVVNPDKEFFLLYLVENYDVGYSILCQSFNFNGSPSTQLSKMMDFDGENLPHDLLDISGIQEIGTNTQSFQLFYFQKPLSNLN